MLSEKSLLYLGIGNEILTDDGIGIRLIKDLQDKVSDDQSEFLTVSLGGMDILEIIKDYKEVIIIDAIKTIDGSPGDVYYFRHDDLNETLHISNFHDISFLEAIKLGKILEINIPEKIHIIAIEIVEDMVFSNQLSPDISKKYQKIKADVLEIISTLRKNIKVSNL